MIRLRSEEADLRTACRAFIAAAFEALREEHVVPTPIFHPYVAVGRDYFGGTIMALTEHHTLETQVDNAYPERFAGPAPRPHAEFATTYIFSFLEACVARCAREGTFEADSPAVEESIGELLAVLDTSLNEIVCCRHVSHLTTASGAEVQIGDEVEFATGAIELAYCRIGALREPQMSNSTCHHLEGLQAVGRELIGLGVDRRAAPRNS